MGRKESNQTNKTKHVPMVENDVFRTWILWLKRIKKGEGIIVYKTWMKVFRIIPEFRILRLTFNRKSASKCEIRQSLIASLIYFQFIFGQ